MSEDPVEAKTTTLELDSPAPPDPLLALPAGASALERDLRPVPERAHDAIGVEGGHSDGSGRAQAHESTPDTQPLAATRHAWSEPAAGLGGRSKRALGALTALVGARPTKMTTRLDTLGGLRVFQNEQELTSLPRRPMQCALLVYLALERTATRDTVMAVLWPEKELEKARGSLNNTAYELRRALGDDWVAVHGDTLRVREDIETDVSLLATAVEERRFTDAVALMSRPFLDGLHLARSTEFEQWVDRQRSRVDQLERAAHRGLVRQHHEGGRASDALGAARAWVGRAPHDDEAHYWLIRLLAEGGHRADALKTYDRFATTLLDEFGVEPDDTVRDVADKIRTGEISGFRPTTSSLPPAADSPKPPPATPPPRTHRDGQTPDEVWRPHPGWAGKLVKGLGFYLVPSIAALELLGTLIENGVLPEELFRPALTLVLLGVPVVAATAFLQSQPVMRGARGGVRHWIARWFTWRNTVLGGVAAAAAFATLVVALPPQRPAWNRVPPSVAVLPFQLPTSTEEERALTVQLADAMTEELHNWTSVQAASEVAVSGARLELGLEQPTLSRASVGVDLARELEAQAMIAIAVSIDGDSASVEATLYDTRSGLRSAEPLVTTGPRSNWLLLAAPILAQVLGFGDASSPVDAFGAGTRSAEAAGVYLDGREELARNRLASAEELFRHAVALDSTFAAAMTYVAQTIFWSDGIRVLTEGQTSEVSRWSTAAMGRLRGLSARNSLHVRGFYAFQLGNYPEARAHYGALLRLEPDNVNAHMMVGQIESHDPWLVPGGDAAFTPRGSLAHAWRAYAEAVRLEPTFEPAYSRLIEIQGRVERTLSVGACPGFDVVRDEIRPPWQRWTPSDLGQAFCPAAMDSITWMTRAAYTSLEDGVRRAGADRLFRETELTLERWASFSPMQPHPHEQLAELLLSQRGRFEVAAPERLQSIAADALAHASTALGLRADTTVEQLVNLANLHLGAGRPDTAAALARVIVDRHGRDRLSSAPLSLIQVLATVGQSTLAMAVASGNDGWYLIPDPGGGFVSTAGAEPIVDRIRILGAQGASGPLLHSELDELSRTWGGAGYSEAQQQLLRDEATLRIAPSLAADPSAISKWAELSSIDHPLWVGLTVGGSNPTAAAVQLERARATETPGLGAAHETFLLGALAGLVGDHAAAIRHYSRLDSIPFLVRPRTFDSGWGLQALSDLLRAEHYEHLGEDSRAREHYRRFQSTRSWPDSISLPSVRRAQAGVERLSR